MLCLEGVKILDMSRVLALPLATMILSDLGAEVIKVENPKGGDETRGWGPPYFNGDSAYYLCVNRNKKSVAIDIKKEEDLKILKELIKQSDVLVENFKPGSLEKYGLDYESVKKINESIIYCSLSGFGQDGPYSHLPGYDFVIQGMSGLMSITGEPGGQPMKVGVAITDVIAGLYATVSILAALYSREKNGVGDYIDISLLDCAISSLVNVASNYLVSKKIPKRYGNAHPNIVPYQTFKSADGYFNLAVGNDKQWSRLVDLLDRPQLRQEKFATNPQRVINRKELIDILQDIFIEKTSEEWVKLFRSANIPCGTINNIKEVFDDPHVIYRNFVKIVEHPETRDKLSLVGSPIKFKNHKIRDPQYPPALGSFNKEIIEKIKRKFKKNSD